MVAGLCGDDECEAEISRARADARFCSGACRQRSYRRRKRLLAPYGGDPAAALAAIISRPIGSVTDRGVTRRHADG